MTALAIKTIHLKQKCKVMLLGLINEFYSLLLRPLPTSTFDGLIIGTFLYNTMLYFLSASHFLVFDQGVIYFNTA